MKKLLLITLTLLLVGFTACSNQAGPVKSVTITVQNAEKGAPVKFGIPFPKGELFSTDHVRVLNAAGEEIPSQKTKVTSWEPVDESIKWLWVFFFADESNEYIVEYGDDVRQEVFTENPIIFKNNQRDNGFAEINTGPLMLRINKGGSGFIDRVQYNNEMSGFGDEHIIATGINSRGSFLDLMDDAGIDTSSAVVHQHFIERGSGPMHAIVRVEGEYEYNDEDHENAPFVTYVHAYAGKSYVKVLHTITYTGHPDKSEPYDGRQHPDIATQTELIIDEQVRSQDSGLTEPNDRIASMGFGLNYHIDGDKIFKSGLETGRWWEDGDTDIFELNLDRETQISVFQTGPEPSRTPPVEFSDRDNRMDGFSAVIRSDEILRESEKAEGWFSLSDEKWGVSVGIRNMLEEYPNEFVVDLENNQIHAYTWSPNEEPMSFARANSNSEAGMVGNFARGITKTSEIVLNFHKGDESNEEIRKELYHIMNPPVAHAGADWYSRSGVYGQFAGVDHEFQELERSIQYKLNWMLFNQKWEPWYGMFDYGDVMNYYFNYNWVQWANNEPAMDYQWWLNFMRSGNSDYYHMARAMSRHSMDVDNTHWPRPNWYRGDTNRSLDAFDHEMQDEISPYVGMGRRHSMQQWTSMLSAHVWVQGWIASYYLDGYHRGLDVARLTGDYYVRRIFGEHGLTGRRLYLSVWSLSELYDATKDQVYLDELNDRVDQMLRLQKSQGGRIAIDRYGYSQNYISHGLSKYQQMFDRPEVREALIDNAHSLYNVGPRDHDMESFLSSIHPLLVGYDLTGEDKFFIEACERSSYLLVNELPMPIFEYNSQGDLRDALEEVSNLPSAGEGPSFRGRNPIWTFSNGMRIFGWTHVFNVPYTIDRLKHRANTEGLPCVN
tara:strand:- start:83438 stop:86104 length:2667 start_codon:yes stop_codon:yes gene_type:complete